MEKTWWRKEVRTRRVIINRPEMTQLRVLLNPGGGGFWSFEKGTAAVSRKCGRNVGFWAYTVGVLDVEMEIPECCRRKVLRCRKIGLGLRPIQ